MTSPRLIDRAVAWLQGWRAERQDRPFFLFLHLWDVHYDYAPSPPYDRLFDPDYSGTSTFFDFESNEKINSGMPKRDLAHLVALYDGEIRFTDEHLGRLFAWLEGAGLRDDTIVVVTADHGDEFFEHGQSGHRKTLYEESIRVPFVLRYPRRVPGGQVIDELVRLMDVAPTVLSLAGVERPKAFGLTEGPKRGRSLDLSPWIVGADSPAAFPEIIAFNRTTTGQHILESAHTQRFKLIRTQSSRGFSVNSTISSKTRPRRTTSPRPMRDRTR